MTDFSLNKDMNIEVMVRFICKGPEIPLTGDEYLVRLYDKDIFSDDFLGECIPDENGIVKFIFSTSAFTNPANLDEKPDFNFVVYKNKQEIFKSKVMEDLDLASIENYKMGEGEVIDLGTYLVET